MRGEAAGYDPVDLAQRLKRRAATEGCESAGVCRLRPSDHGDLLERWLADGLHGDMAYLERDDAVARRLDPRARDQRLRSALVIADSYGAGDLVDPADRERATIARYARGRDYHRVVKGRLRRLLRWLEGEVGRPLPAARACVDTSPVLERELARTAGLGWFGRNTMLIHPRRGSYFFLGVLLTELELAPDEPFTADHCGTCRACLDACPTDALLGRDSAGAPVMDARRCISYLTIEHRGPIPAELRPAIGNRVFGCDICQEVCPFNVRFATSEGDPAYAARGPGEAPAGVAPVGSTGAAHPGTDAPALLDLLRMSEEEWDEFSRGSAIRRAGYVGFRRNVVVAIGNWLAGPGPPDDEAVRLLGDALEDEEPLVREHAAWALERAAERRLPVAILPTEDGTPPH
ncbi:MAG: tRNA epoxyqueuosine(34) reductase QueG [Gemmatimonadota bacterium]